MFQSNTPLAWGELDLPMVAIAKDWHGAPLDPAPGYSIACDSQAMWFLAHHRAPATNHPKSRPGCFLAGLWEYDVAELFLADPVSGRYFEFNLAPNAAWWNCEFTAPRQRADEVDIAMPDVATWSDLAADGSWVAAMSIPLEVLRARIDFGPATRANVTFILGTPAQRFVTAAAPAGETPDFHQPERFEPLGAHQLDALRYR